MRGLGKLETAGRVLVETGQDALAEQVKDLVLDVFLLGNHGKDLGALLHERQLREARHQSQTRGSGSRGREHATTRGSGTRRSGLVAKEFLDQLGKGVEFGLARPKQLLQAVLIENSRGPPAQRIAAGCMRPAPARTQPAGG